MKTETKIEEWEFKEIEKALESVLGYCGSWSGTDIIEVRKRTGHATSMRIDVFLKDLRDKFGLIKSRSGDR